MTKQASPLRSGSIIGILGTGQLGRMLSLAGAQLGFKIHIFGPEENAPASEVSWRTTTADYRDEIALTHFAESVDVVTYEFENVPQETANFLSQFVPVRPPVRALDVAQDRLTEKNFLKESGLSVAGFQYIETYEDLQEVHARFDGQGIIKTCRFGYDGKGQWQMTPETDLKALMNEINNRPAICEAFIPFDGEVSVVAARSTSGQIATFDIAENIHENHILRHSFVPAGLAESLLQQAADMARLLLTELDYVGVLTLEIFVCQDKLLINEIAPRVHNSGHWTIDACATDQFEQHMRAVAGWPLGSPNRQYDAVMTNLLGTEINHIDSLAEDEMTKIHFYGKHEAKAGRKMGHVSKLFKVGHRPDREGYKLF